MTFAIHQADAAAVWRGPMAMKALDQIIFKTAWGPLDILVIDMPPGEHSALRVLHSAPTYPKLITLVGIGSLG
eukprot:scaffold482069_cov34-Prasinocladus_malaysianus.AAC.1